MKHGPAALWQRHDRILSLIGLAYLGIAATGRLYYALPYLLRDLAPWSAIDLRYRHNEVAEWFAGNPVYGIVDGAVYPPASHAILWPFMGWTSFGTARAIWAVTTIAAAVAIALIAYRACTPAPPRHRLLIAGLAIAGYPLQLSIFPGQMGMHVVALVGVGALLLISKRSTWLTDLLAGVLLAASLVKPTSSAPLVIAALMAARRWRPALLAAGAYACFTLIAVAAQPDGLFALLRDWLAVASVRVSVMGGVPNLHMLLALGGMRDWMSPASLVVLVAMMAWLWRHRSADPWLFMGVAGIVARLWAHSTLYDDAFLLLPALALLRIAYLESGDFQRAAGYLLAVSWAALLTPTWVFYDLAPAVVWAVHVSQTLLWLAVLGFLMITAAVPGHQGHGRGSRRTA